jgi:hypothetical protein
MSKGKRTQPKSQERSEIAQAVFKGMREGLSALRACQAAGVSQSTFNGWLDADPELVAEYVRAREDLIELIATQTIEIADAPVGSTDSGATDNGAVQKQRLQVDTRKWLLSKLAPKKYGDRLAIAGDKDSPLEVKQTIDASKLSTDVLAQIMAAKDATNGS